MQIPGRAAHPCRFLTHTGKPLGLAATDTVQYM